MNKVIRDGKVAVLVSPGFGSGWACRAGEIDESKLFCSAIVHAIEAGVSLKTRYTIAEELYPDDVYGLEKLRIQWVDVGRKFIITEYDGSESIEFLDEMRWVTA